MIADIEKLASNFLRNHADIQALSARVVGKTPDSITDPWVRVIQLDAANEQLSRPEYLISHLIQFDCYAGKDGGQPEANLLGRTVRVLLHDEFPGARDGTQVTGVRFLGMARMPDDNFEPNRERVVITAEVHAHS